jgi:hypothetical protein
MEVAEKRAFFMCEVAEKIAFFKWKWLKNMRFLGRSG